MKKLFQDWRWYALVIFLSFGVIMAADIQRGITFSSTEHITATKLHNLIDEATISTTFVTDLSAAQPSASDVFLFCQPGTPIYRKVTYNTMLLGATNLITSQSELDLPVTNDFMLLFDTSAGGLVKTPLISLFTNVNGILFGLPDYTNVPAGGFSYAYGYQGNGGRIEHSNLFAGFWQWERFSTNVASTIPQTNPFVMSIHTAPTNADGLLIWDAVSQTNKATTLAGLVTNLPPVPEGKLTNSDSLIIFSRSTNAFASTGIVAQVSVTNLAHFVVQKYVSAPFAVPNSVTGTTNLHGLPGTPQIFKADLVCVTPELGFSVGDQADFNFSPGNTMVGCNSTNIWLSSPSVTVWTVVRRDTAALATITKANWNVKFEAFYFP